MLIHGELNPSPTMPKGQNMIMSPRNIKVLMKGSNTFPSTKINEEEQRTKETKNGKIHMENIASLASDFLCEYIDEKKKEIDISYIQTISSCSPYVLPVYLLLHPYVLAIY